MRWRASKFVHEVPNSDIILMDKNETPSNSAMAFCAYDRAARFSTGELKPTE
jgi:hypothetical protein